MADPTDRDPASFPGNPNPPAKIPDTSGVKPPPAAEPTSAGTGALPPSAAGGDVPPSSPAAPSTSFRVYTEEDGGHSIYSLKDDGSGEKVGTATATDTQKILDAAGTFNPTTKSWDVPPEIAKSLMTGRLGFPEQISKSWEGGETGVVQAFNAMAWIDGKMPFEEAKARNEQTLLKDQLAPNGQPGLAWDKLGQYAADALKHPGDALAEIGKYTAGQLAAFAPTALEMGKGAAEGALTTGGPALTAALATGTIELPPVAAGVAWLAGAGALAGAAKTLINLETGGAAARMMQQGLPEDIIRSNAIWQGSAKGVLWMTSAALLPAPMKLKLLETLAESPVAQKMAANWAVKYGGQVAAGTGLMVAQEKIRQIFNNMAASAANRPDLLIQGKEGLDQLLDAAASGAAITGALGAYGAAKGATAPAEGPGAPLEPGAPGQEPAPAATPQSGEPAVAPSASGSPEGKIEPGSQTSELPAPLDPSVTEHPTFVKAAEEAKPFLGKIDPTDKEGVIGAYSDIVQEHHDFINKVQVAMAKDKITDAISDKMRAQAEKMAALSKLAKIVHDPEKALPYFSALEDGKESLLPPPADPYDVAKASAEMGEKPAPAAEEAAPAGENKYVLNREMDVKSLGDEKTTAKNARDEYSGIHNEQLVRGNQLADEIKRDVPDPVDRQGMFWYKAAEGDKTVLEHALQDPDLEKYHDQIERALNLPDHAVEALKKVDQYYKESGQVSSDVGTIRNVIENYQNRLYQQDDGGAHTESETNFKQTTGHAKQRVFDTEFDAARAGKTFATTDVADALALHNGEMAGVNARRSLADTMVEGKLLAWTHPDNVPDGWQKIEGLTKDVALKGPDGKALIGEDGNQVHSRSVLSGPPGIVDGLRAITDRDWTKKLETLKNVQSAQGAVKTGFLSWSFFHHLSFISQLVYRGDFSSLMQLGNMDAALSHPDFLENEKDFALHGGMTSQVEANADIERGLAKALDGESFLGGDKTFKGAVNDVKDAPVVKQVLEQTDKNANFLFGKMQRLWKTNTYAAERSNWIAGHLDATNEEVTTALRGIAASTNDIFGGQNWEAMGMTKSNLSLLRLGILAPDWTASNMSLLKHAAGIGDNATENSMSRAHLIKSLAVGMIGTELMNKILTGHTTDKNKPGHKLEVEVAPNVYVSLIRGGPSDILKLGSMAVESGAAGVDRFAAGKLSPAARIIIGLASNTQYGSKQIVPQKDKTKPVAATYDVLKYVLSNASPIPLGISNLMQYGAEKHKTAVGAAMVGSGVGRYSPPPRGKQ